MSDLRNYVKEQKNKDKVFAENYDKGYEDFKIGVLLKKARRETGITQEELARKIHTKKSVISRMERHAEDIKLSTLKKVAEALGKRLDISIA